jgi:hypothetical protein
VDGVVEVPRINISPSPPNQVAPPNRRTGSGTVFVIASVSSADSFRQTTPRHITQMGDDARSERL